MAGMTAKKTFLLLSSRTPFRDRLIQFLLLSPRTCCGVTLRNTKGDAGTMAGMTAKKTFLLLSSGLRSGIALYSSSCCHPALVAGSPFLYAFSKLKILPTFLSWRSFGAHWASPMPCGCISAIGNVNITCGTQFARI